MAYRVFLVENAERDIEGIHSYIAQSDSTVQADRTVDQFEALCDSLVNMPQRGNRPKELRELGIDQYLELHSGPYRLIYQMIGDDVVVHCVLDGRRDMESLLQQRLLR